MKTCSSVCLAVLILIIAVPGLPGPTSPVQMTPVPKSKLCVTEGKLEERQGNRLRVTVPKVRAVVAAVTPQAVEARLTYLGPARDSSSLGSGEMRRQFGLKLRAQDGCNLVYAVWRIKPKSELVVSIKRNPDQHSSSECGNHGYRNIKASHSTPVPQLTPGDSHSLLADINGSKMRVSVDGTVVWEGDLGPEALAFDGPVGVRTDNGRFEFELLTGELGAPRACREGEKEDE